MSMAVRLEENGARVPFLAEWAYPGLSRLTFTPFGIKMAGTVTNFVMFFVLPCLKWQTSATPQNLN